MPASNSTMQYKLQVALNSRGYKILCNRSQFYSEQQHRPITKYQISQSIENADTGKHNHLTLFETYSQIQAVLFMRNLWYLVNGKPIPPTNKMKGAEKFEAGWDIFMEKFGDRFLSNEKTV